MNKKTKKALLGNIAGWFFGILFLLSGTVSFFEPTMGVIAGIFYFSAAVLCLPPAYQAISMKFKTPLSTGKRIAFAVLLMIMAPLSMSLLNAADEAAKSSIKAIENSVPSSKGLVVEDVEFKTKKYGNKVLVGILKNTTDREYGYVQIQFNLYDKDGVQVGSTLANVNNLEPQSTWKFEAGIIEENVTMFKVKDITGF
ncbi:MAG: hypothetical protein H6859_09815 [Rhodospirillales bacterium]|nr:FxLYD domain-containing protein [Alphaproteobacteria bacterium]USO05422.1 MAG: hypothetical protein H6859_09815 [Rhodospirillales bacterium]